VAIGVTSAGPPDAAAWFAETYGREPDGIWFAPGRVNLMGGPDYTEGFVLPFALGVGVTAAAARRPDRRITLVSRQQKTGPIVADIDSLEPGSVPGWAAYPAGVAWALRQAGYLESAGADIAIDADLPAGAGLSSSAALECATALALTELHQLPVPRPELAALGRRAENDFAGIPSGIMDQIAALLSRAGHALLLDCRTGTGTPVPLDPAAAGLTLLVIDTRAGHALGDGRYAERRRDCDRAASALQVRSLRDITEEDLARLSSDPPLQRLAGHVLAEQRRVLHAADLLQAGHQASLGPLLTASHHSLRDRFHFSWPQADEAVEAALEAGAAGARMTGGGFGGSVIALVPARAAAQIRQNVTARFARHHWPAPHFLDAVPSDAARRLR
jgi:galactokinase